MNNLKILIRADLEMTDTDDRALPIFIIQEGEEFIAEDIIGCLKAVGPCRVVHVREADAIAAALAQEPDASVAVLDLSYTEAAESAAVKALIAAGARIILTKSGADEREARARGWGMLARPFTDPMIRAELAGQGVEGDLGRVSNSSPSTGQPL